MNNGFEVDIIADSVPAQDPYEGTRITTFQLKYPRFIHAEFMTHRMFSRNASSSRAIPVNKIMDDVRQKPAKPIYWGSNKPGMQAGAEIENTDRAQAEWIDARDSALTHAAEMNTQGLHKQIVNRILEPWHFIRVIMTATEMDNFYTLRRHPAAQPEIKFLADMMYHTQNLSHPKSLNPGEWHLPYIQDKEKHLPEDYLLRISTARCARVSYLNHDNSNPDIDKDMALWKTLYESGHMSPFEHQATPMEIPKWNPLDVDLNADIKGVTHYDTAGNAWSGNFKGWVQQRHII
jgi:thymidylate synthase ThyX